MQERSVLVDQVVRHQGLDQQAAAQHRHRAIALSFQVGD
jgi:hypothetical protein